MFWGGISLGSVLSTYGCCPLEVEVSASCSGVFHGFEGACVATWHGRDVLFCTCSNSPYQGVTQEVLLDATNQTKGCKITGGVLLRLLCLNNYEQVPMFHN